MLALLGCEQSLIFLFWVTWTNSTRARGDQRIRCSRVLWDCLWCYREHTPSLPFTCQALEHENTRFLQLFYVFPTRLFSLFFFLIVTALPCKKSPKGQTKYHICCMKKEKDKEKKEKGRKRKEGKQGNKKKAHIVPCPPQPFFDSPQTSCGTPEAKAGGSVWKNGSNDSWIFGCSNFANVNEV